MTLCLRLATKTVDNEDVDALEKQQMLARKSLRDLVARSVAGVVIQPACMLIICWSIGLTTRTPEVARPAIALLIFISICRYLSIRVLRARGFSLAGVTPVINLGLILIGSGVWGITAGALMLRFGYDDRDVLKFLLYHAAVCIGSVHVVAHSRRLIGASLAILIVPPLAADLIHGGPNTIAYPAVALLFAAYSFAQGSQLYRQYHQHLSDHYDLSVAAYRDCLTGLANRLCIHRTLEEWAGNPKAIERRIALIYIDLDGFKQINDRYSHKVGDLFLCEAATRMTRCLRRGDVAARIGGDEFAVLMFDVSEEEVSAVADRLLTTAREPVLIEEKALHYSASIGLSLYPNSADGPEMLLRTADEAMYRSKSKGKNCVSAAPSLVNTLTMGVRSPDLSRLSIHTVQVPS